MQYRGIGTTRSYGKVVKKLNKSRSYLRQIQLWSSNHEWVIRTNLYDDWLDGKKLELANKHLQEIYDYTLQESKGVIDKLVSINQGYCCSAT